MYQFFYKNTDLKTLFLFLIILNGCLSEKISLMEGQEGTLNFPYPCDSTEVTLQYSHRLPFYRSSDGPLLLSLPQDQARRFKVHDRRNSDDCSLDLTISNLIRNDEGTYILSVYKDQQLLIDNTHRIWLGIDYPPGKASLIKSEDKGGNWIAIECAASAGSLSGKIECYQNGEKMPSVTEPTETDNTLKQTILIRKAQPAFCCSSTLGEDKGRCRCNETAYLADTISKDLCSDKATITMTAPTLEVTGNKEILSQSHHLSTTLSSTLIKENSQCKSVIIHSIFLPVEFIVFILSVIINYKLRTRTRTKGDSHLHDPKIPMKTDHRISKRYEGTVKRGE